ncbi:MAG: hypothetical protein IIY21_10885 [Clostridiales bacterium]|nr:hypothetical protein [Clostridiales bacterium]MBQ1571187.1 hypothetical protein [Clostridiales bacterium]
MKSLKEFFTFDECISLVTQALVTALDLDPTESEITTVSRTIYFKHGKKPISPVLEEYEEVYEHEELPSQIGSDIGIRYEESWNRIRAALAAEYNPIENYDRKELTIIDHTGTDTDTFGQQINTQGQQTNISGQREDTVGAQSHTQGQQETTYGNTSKTYGAKETEYGATSKTYGVKETEYGATSKTYGQEQTQYGSKVTSNISVTDTDQNDVSAYNVSTYQPNAKNTHVSGPTETTEGSHTDVKSSHTDTELAHTDTERAHTDTELAHTDTEKAHTDTETSHTDTVGARTDNDGARTDVKGQQSDTIGSRQDTIGQKIDEHEKDTTDSTDSYIHGNVGVTTNQQMIEAEMRLRSMYKFWDIVSNDITNEITLHVYA